MSDCLTVAPHQFKFLAKFQKLFRRAGDKLPRHAAAARCRKPWLYTGC
jgi:hypothetical protein